MKKLLSMGLIIGSVSLANAYNINIVKGWNNIGLNEDYNISTSMNNNIDIIWHYNNQKKEWEVFSKKYNISTYPHIKDNIKNGDAVWLFSDINQTINISSKSKNIIASYGNYQIIKNNNKYYFKDINLSKEFYFDVNGSIQNTEIRAIENGALFDFISKTGKNYNDSNSTAYVGYFDGNNISLKKVGTSKYLNNFNDISLLPNNQYLMMFNGCCNNDATFLVFFNPENNKFNIEKFSNVNIENTSYNYKNNKRILDELSLYDTANNKTIIYKFNENGIKIINLEGKWRNYQQIDDNLIFVSNYNYSNGDKIAVYDDNGKLISQHQFDKIIRGVGVDYNNNSDNNSTMYIFTQNDINETLNIYSSDDYGENWNRVLSVNNFNYMISYIENVHKKNDGNLSIRMSVNDYRFSIETDDSFKTIKKINYRKNNDILDKNIEDYGNQRIVIYR